MVPEGGQVFVEARTVAEGEVVEADVCVAGGGVAGLATALELEAAGLRVALVERGESLEEGEVDGSYPPLGSTRAAGVGGTAALWTAELAPGQLGARYAPLAPIDFEAREEMPWSGWPFDRAHLEPHAGDRKIQHRANDRSAAVARIETHGVAPVHVGARGVPAIFRFLGLRIRHHAAVVAAEVIVIPRSCSCSIQSIVAAPSCTSPIL